MRFIRDDIRVRDLDARYKKTMRLHAKRSVPYAPTWFMALKISQWESATLIEKVAIKGA